MERTRLLGLLALGGLGPVVYYMLGSGSRWITLSMLSVVIIAASLVTMLGPSPDPA